MSTKYLLVKTEFRRPEKRRVLSENVSSTQYVRYEFDDINLRLKNEINNFKMMNYYSVKLAYNYDAGKLALASTISKE